MYPLDYQVTVARLLRLRLEELRGAAASDEVEALRAALERLRSNELGICAACGGEITYWSLMAAPTSTMCEACSTRCEACSSPA
jgi:RNA polymerase-binding transcription factor DksA